MGTIANAKVTHYYNCYNGDFIGCLHFVQNDILFSKPIIHLHHRIERTNPILDITVIHIQQAPQCKHHILKYMIKSFKY